LTAADHIIQVYLSANTQDSSLVSHQPPSYTALFLAALLTLVSGLTLSTWNDIRKQRSKNNDQMVAMNQSLALLLEKQGETTRDLSEHTAEIRALNSKGSAYETSLALLKQAIEMHIQTSEEDRKGLHQKIDLVRDGVRDYRHPIDRRSNERD